MGTYPPLERGLLPRFRQECEHLFVTAQGSPRTRFRRALAGGNPNIAWAAALELEHIELSEALDLVYVLAGAGDRRFSAAAGRWRGLLALERGLRLEQALAAACALVVLREDPQSEYARTALERLLGQ